MLAALLGGIYCLAVGYRIGICHRQLARHGSALFTGESALTFRYLQMAARGSAIPELDREAQVPEGLRVRECLSVGMETLVGRLYRLRPVPVDLSLFVRYFIPIFFGTGILAAYLIGRTVFGGPGAGIIAACFYGLGLPALIRSTGVEISQESFTLPLIFFHLAFFLSAGQGTGGFRQWKKGDWLRALAAGALLAAALATWEGTQLYFYFLTAFSAGKFLFGRRRDERYFSVWSVSLFAAAAAGTFVPYLRAHGFLFSYSVLTACCLLAVLAWTRGREPAGREKTVFVLLAALAIGGAVWLSGYHRTYAHFQSLLFYKLRFLNRKPLDPLLLPYEVRILWTPALLGPSAAEAFGQFFTLFVVGAVALAVFVFRCWRGRSGGGEIFVYSAAAFFFLLYLLFSRMQVFLSFFLALLAGGVFVFLREQDRRWRRRLGMALLGLSLLFEGWKGQAEGMKFDRPVDYASLEELLGWVRDHTAGDAVILTHFNHSPPLLTYAGRAIVLQPKFETPELREKVKRYAFSLFADGEEQFYDFCRDTGSSYFVFPKGTFSDSSVLGWRYMTATGGDRRSSLAWRFEYRPDRLERFLPVHENRKFLVFRVVTPAEIGAAEELQRQAGSLLAAGRGPEAIAELKKALAVCPNLTSTHAALGGAYYLNGEREKAAQEWERVRQLGSAD